MSLQGTERKGRKMKHNKLIGTLIAITQLAAFAVYPLGAAAEEENPAVVAYNDGDIAGWSTADANGTVSQIEEDGNKWARLTTNQLDWGGAQIPRMVYDLGDKKIKFKEGQKIIIETQLRAQGADNAGRAAMHYNVFDKKVTYDGAESTTSFQRNHLILWQLYGCGPDKPIEFAYAGGVTQGQTLNKWISNCTAPLVKDSVFKVTMVWNAMENKAEFTLREPSGSIIEKSNDLGYRSMSEYLENVSISNIVTKCDYIDVDYMKISVIEQETEAELLGANEKGEIIKDKKFDIKFKYPIDESTVDGNISLVGSDGNPVELEKIEYDSKTYTLSLIPSADGKPLANGQYKIIIGKGIKTTDIYADYAEFDCEASIPVKPAEFEFIYFATDPPEVKGLPVIKGNAETGEILSAEYTYFHADGIEEDKDGTLIEWFVSDKKDGSYKSTGITGDKFELLPEHENKFIKVRVTPKDISGMVGNAAESESFAAPAPPIAENVEIKGTLVCGGTVKLSYGYYDANGDAQGESEYRWYISDSSDGTFELLENTEKTLQLTNDMKGKYLKASVLPIAQKAPFEGVWTESKAYGPVMGDLRDATNLVKNSGFETGDTSGYKTMGDLVIQAVKDPEKAHSGEYYMLATNRKAAGDGWGYQMPFDEHTAYLVSVYAKLDTKATVGYTTYTWEGTLDSQYDRIDYPNDIAVTGNEWSEVSGILVGITAHNSRPCITAWGDNGNVMIDDMYVGKLAISDIDAEIPEEIEIPASGETKINITLSAMYNQLGTEVGMLNKATGKYPYVKYEVPDDVNGMRIEDEYDRDGNFKATYLIVNNSANAGEVELLATVDPEKTETNAGRRYWGVEPFTKAYTINLKGNGITTPRVTDAKLEGTVNAGDTLKVTYSFYQLYKEEDKSEIKWFYSPDNVKEYEQISGAAGTTYTVPEDKAGGFFKAEITAKTAAETGNTQETNPIGPPTAPVAKNIKISGDAFVGETLKATYDWYDFNGDEQGTDLYIWQRADSENGEFKPIEGAVTDSYTLQDADIGKFIRVEVTPVSKTEPTKGAAATSEAFAGPMKPVAKNLSISKNNNVLTGSYEYYQQGGAQEGESQYRWIVGGEVVSTGVTYIITSKSSVTVTFEVTPVSSKEPSKGETVSITKTFSGKGSSGGSSSGGGSVGGYAGGSVSKNGGATPNVVPSLDNKKSEPSAADAFEDIKNHWGFDAIKWAVEEEIMSGKTDKAFEPNTFATRRETIEYFGKVLGFSGTEYTGIFEDVESGEFANLLQTFVDKGVISRDVRFRPNDYLSRQELCKLLALSLGLKIGDAETTAFADNEEIGTWAIPYVNAVSGEKLVLGVGENRFNPKGKVTRAQTATLLMRVSELVKAK